MRSLPFPDLNESKRIARPVHLRVWDTTLRMVLLALIFFVAGIGSARSYQSTLDWQNVGIPAQATTFTISFDFVPGQAGMDGFVGLSNGATDDFNDMACSVRVFRQNGTTDRFEAYRTNTYTAVSTIPYTAGQSYRVAMTINVAAKTYSVTVNGQTLAQDYAFRSAQSGVPQLNNLVLRHQSGSYSLNEVDFGPAIPLPANDQFANSVLLPGVSGSFEGYNHQASLEPGEPATVDGDPAARSVWFRWVAPSHGAFSSWLSAPFDSQLSVYSGTTPSALSLLAHDRGPYHTQIDMPVVQGQTYMIRVTGSANQPVSFTMNWAFVVAASLPANDAFASSQILSGPSGSRAGTLANATLEPGEATTVEGYTSHRSVWYCWIAPSSGTFTCRATTEDSNQAIAIYTGSALNTLTMQAEEYNGDPVTVAVTNGATYYVRVTGGNSAFTLEWQSTQSPDNDRFAKARPISGSFGTSYDTTANASLEAGEPATVTGKPAGRSVWFRWTPPATGTARFELTADFDSQLSVFTGAALGSLSLAGENDSLGLGGDVVQFSAVLGTTYHIRITGNSSVQGIFWLRWSSAPAASGQAFGYENLVNFDYLNAANSDQRLAGRLSSVPLLALSDGTFLGTTSDTVFKFNPSGQSSTLANFADILEGSPAGRLLKASDGSFYGTTSESFFRMTPTGIITTVASYDPSEDSWFPAGGLVQGTDGFLYGMMYEGGTNDHGTIYRISVSGNPTPLINFTGTTGSFPGSSPVGQLLLASDGSFYGVTRRGGSLNNGTLFRLTIVGGSVTFSKLADFTGAAGIGVLPEGGLLETSDGNIYGVTGGDFDNIGTTIFRWSPASGLATAHDFGTNGNNDSGEGVSPNGGLVQASDGAIYGTTHLGGTHGQGTLYRLTPDGEFTTLHHFDWAPDEAGYETAYPTAGLTRGADGALYGTASNAFPFGPSGIPRGSIFRFDLTRLEPEILLQFSVRTSDTGINPQPKLVEHPNGFFYGCTTLGGLGGSGSIFRITPYGRMTTLVNFANGEGTSGELPEGGLLLASDGNLYGTTRGDPYGGTEIEGSFFRISPAGVFTKLKGFDGPLHDGPFGQLSQDNLGNIYGYIDLFDGEVGRFKYTPSGNFTTDRTWDPYGLKSPDGNSYFVGPRPSLGQSWLYRGVLDGDAVPLVQVSATITVNRTVLRRADGSYYGTLGSGGSAGLGQAFKINPAGVFQTIASFTGTGPNGGGANPFSELVETADGSLYGVTSGTTVSDPGTIFRLTPAGQLQTVFDFTHDPSAARPYADLTLGSDGNLYGTSHGVSGKGGSIFRILLPGTPLVYPIEVDANKSTAAVTCYANARGERTVVRAEYGIDGTGFPSEHYLTLSAEGFATGLHGGLLSNLVAGQTYRLRFRATNVFGSALSEVITFTTLAEPTVTVDPADELTPRGATLRGKVNPRGFKSVAHFEYGTDGIVFPNSLPVSGEFLGTVPIAVSARIPDVLNEGTPYFFRLVAVSEGGTGVSGTREFTTLTQPVVTLGSTTALTTTKAKVEGMADAKGSTTAVFVEWGTNGITFPNSVATGPASVSGSGPLAVSATLTNLTQGTTYHYRLRATGPGGTGFSEVGVFTLTILSGLDQEPPFDLPLPTGALAVNLSPSATGGWRFAGETRWRLSGESVTGLASGERLVEFMPVPGYLHPPGELVEIFSGESPVVLEAEYFLQAGTPTGTGGLQVTLEPAAVANAANPPRWRLLGLDQGSSGWLASGQTRSGLLPGNYLVECEDFPGRVTPQPASVQVSPGASKLISLTYVTRPPTQGQLVQPVDPSVFSDETLPLSWVGQLRGPLGTSSGFAVKRRVVATAAHVVFDDATQAFVPDLQWLHQRHAGLNEPVPQTPRGFYLSSSYEAERRKPGIIPGEGTDRSQHYDYAALYFLTDVARGGFSGFLASEGDENEFLTDGTSQKILAGYATDIANPADRGKLHATTFTGTIPAFALTQIAGTIEEVVDNVTSHVAHGTYTTTAVSGRAGCSGGPLFVRHANGSFYPAAIYIGDSGPGIGTVVRGIDRRVVQLFGLAETRSYGGGNNTDGGKTLTTTSLGSATERGALKVVLLPAGLPGAGWRLQPSTTVRESGYQRDRLRKGSYSVWIAPVPGYVTPPEETVTINADELLTYTYTYQAVLTPQQTWRQTHFGSAENTGPGADGADPDGDGTTNLDEYAAGSNPKSATDFFRVSSATRGPGSFTVILAGKKDRTYTLQRRDATTGSWLPVLPATGPLAADNPALTLSDSNPSSASALYRVFVALPEN